MQWICPFVCKAKQPEKIARKCANRFPMMNHEGRGSQGANELERLQTIAQYSYHPVKYLEVLPLTSTRPRRHVQITDCKTICLCFEVERLPGNRGALTYKKFLVYGHADRFRGWNKVAESSGAFLAGLILPARRIYRRQGCERDVCEQA